jgi:hypothetical protein
LTLQPDSRKTHSIREVKQMGKANQASVAVMGSKVVERVTEARGEARRFERHGRVQEW